MNTAELILNKDGSIYHLGLRPEQLAPLILTVGDPERVHTISQRLEKVELRVQKREFVTHTGFLGKKRISIISTGIGPDNIDIVLNELDALVNIDLARRQPRPEPVSLQIIRLGTTGGLQAEWAPGSLVASAGGIGLDGLLHFYKAPLLQYHPLVQALKDHAADAWDFPLAPYYAPADPGLLSHWKKDFAVGYTATNPGFYGPQGRQLRAPLRFDGYLDLLQSFHYEDQRILNLEMETAAILGLSHLLGHQAASLSVVLANRPKGTFSAQPEKDIERLIDTALSIIAHTL